MMKLLFSLLLLSLTIRCYPATSSTEIESLLNYVGGLEGAVFIRNGNEYAPKKAESHLRMKWEMQQDKIKTAEDFIVLCATKSSMSGELYEIRLKNGKSVLSEVILRCELKRIRAGKGQRLKVESGRPNLDISQTFCEISPQGLRLRAYALRSGLALSKAPPAPRRNLSERKSHSDRCI